MQINKATYYNISSIITKYKHDMVWHGHITGIRRVSQGYDSIEQYHCPLIPAHISRPNPQAKLLTVQASRPGQPGD